MAVMRHWQEYVIEGLGLGVFMLAACCYVTVFEYPTSPVRLALADPVWRRAVLGCTIAATNIALIYSPWGMRSGAHFNPSVTLAFLRLGKVAPRDAACYVAAQFMGGLAGVVLAAALLSPWIGVPSVDFAVTMPGTAGVLAAVLAELAISFGLFLTVLVVSNTPRLAPYTGLCASTLLLLYITFEAPLSGVSMNPARTLASAIPAHSGNALWIYFIAPPLGMLLAAEVYRRWRGPDAVVCAKLHHGPGRCSMFRCGYGAHAGADDQHGNPAPGIG